MMARITYYWEHLTDESRRLRSADASAIASRHLCDSGEVGVIVDDGGPLRILPVDTAGLTVHQVRRALRAAARREYPTEVR